MKHTLNSEVTTNVKSPDRLITMREVRSLIGASRTTIYERIKSGNFPAQVKLGPRTSRWLESEVQAWIEKQIRTRNQAYTPDR